MTDEREFTDAEIEILQREDFYADPDAVTAELYPRATNMSAGMLYRRVIRPRVPVAPEYFTLPLSRHRDDEPGVLLEVTVARWNLLWEAAQLRRRFFAEDDLPPVIAQIADRGDVNVVFVPRTDSRYYEYAPLFHLLPHPTVQRYGLPPLRCGQWPIQDILGGFPRVDDTVGEEPVPLR